jgi:hypothetical protein
VSTDLLWIRPTPRHQGHIVGLFSDRIGRTYTICGCRFGPREGLVMETILPRDWSPCGNCTRLQARRTDVEDEIATERDP